ncbi:hypothetical protein MBCUT_16360 [Methanobrevibacter cuticularis]|uniref:Right handed beta helix domain-containing protein n=1 Tax=Methanobrevibacter cuticularis TaxID=47311 RepID=A0A166D428_9EURY|nr:right-handed parallel beta-helix repeat-containing protein [Methanobrevibacter cuticularis]KZX15182.1 hypothetical protein MBCUT_16360 [Methanobrevibacter cuticularis]
MKNKNKIVTLTFLFLIIIFPLNMVSGVDVYDASYYNDQNLSLSQQIQKIIDSAAIGDTINFLGKSYENLTLVINKKLNIVTNVGTTIKNSDTSSSLNSIFFINGSSAAGTTISGFNISNKNGNGIVLNNTKNIKISKNNISSCKESGISIEKSSNINITQNSIKNSTEGVSISNSNNINMKNNTVTENRNNGITIKNTEKVTIDSNTITKNNGSGLNAYNTTTTNITNNQILNNKESGILTESSAKNMVITKNTIKHNYYGIRLNSNQNNRLTIKSNTINENHDGVSFGPKYVDDKSKTISSNVIYKNSGKEVELIESTYPNLEVGANWYGSNSESFVNLCPKLTTSLIQAKLVKGKGGQYSVVFKDKNGNVMADLPSLDVIFTLNGNNKVVVKSKNGVGSVDYSSILFSLLSQDNFIEMSVDNFRTNQVLSAKDNRENYELWIQESNQPTGNNLGDDNGLGHDNGDGTGNTQGTGSQSSGVKNQNSADSGDTGASAAENSGENPTDSNSAKEIIIQDPALKIEDPQNLTYIIVGLLIGVIIVGYFTDKINL